MKPLNNDNPGCTPISSNCVIWQGGDIPCINLCKGDTVSNVVFKLATELCNILETLNVDTYDLSCFNLGDCTPSDFSALIQLLIEKICELDSCCNSTTSAEATARTAGVPEGSVTIAECFQYKNAQGDLVTYMTVEDYAVTIGNKVCALVGQITTINETLDNHETRIFTLENQETPEPTLPVIAPNCVLNADSATMADVLAALEQQFCELRTATGTPDALYIAIQKQCAGLNQSRQLNGVGNMTDLVGWIDSVSNVGESFINMWLTLCDIRAAIYSIQEACCTTTSCDDLDIVLQGTMEAPSTLKLYFTGSYPLNYNESNPAGATVTVTDINNNSITLTVPIIPNLNDPTGYSVPLGSTPVNPASDLTVTASLSFTDGENVCSRVISTVVLATGICPTMNLTPTETTIAWSMTYLGGPASIATKLYDATGTVLIAEQVNVVAGPDTLANTFVGLTAGVQYRIRNEITVTGALTATICPFASVSTSNPACIPPNNLTGTLTIT